MAILNPNALAATTRTPCGLLLINGVRVDQWKLLEVENNVYYDADRFRVVLAASALPAAMNANWISQQDTISVQIYMGFPADPENFTASELVSYISGEVNEPDFRLTDTVIELEGFDYTSTLIDTQTVEKYPNKTASWIANQIAQAHGFVPKIVATSTLVGRYYVIDQVRQQDRRSEWDLLCWLAEQEGFVVYMHGNELHFEPPAAPGSSDTYLITWQPPSAEFAYPRSNAKRLNFKRNLKISRGVTVTVESFHAADGKTYKQSYPTAPKAGKPGSIGSTTENHYRRIPNLRPDECLAKAQAIYAQLIKHQMRLEADLFGDDLLKTSTLVQVTGTGTAWDQIYFPKRVRRTMTVGGYTMSLEASNAAPDMQEGE